MGASLKSLPCGSCSTIIANKPWWATVVSSYNPRMQGNTAGLLNMGRAYSRTLCNYAPVQENWLRLMAFIHVRPPPSQGQLSRWNCLRIRQVFDKIQQWPHTIKGHHQIRTQNSFPFPAKELKSTHFYQGLSGCPGCWCKLKAGDSSTVTLCR